MSLGGAARPSDQEPLARTLSPGLGDEGVDEPGDEGEVLGGEFGGGCDPVADWRLRRGCVEGGAGSHRGAGSRW
jgi:hypothetical protein